LADPGTIAAAMFVRLIALSGLGVDVANRLGRAIYASQVAAGMGWWLFAAAAFLLFGALVVLAAQRRDGAIWLVLSGLSIAAASLGFGMAIVDPASPFSVTAGERYNFLPLVLIALALIALAMRPRFRGRPVCALLCTLMLLTGAYYYPKPLQDFAEGPSWPAEVAAWRSDHRHPLAVWPRPWTADLSDKTRPCSPSGRDLARSTDPRYCESGWVVGLFPRN
jgi:hypothetical protein